MGQNKKLQQRIQQLKEAFKKDGYTVKQEPLVIKGMDGNPKIGMVAESPATIGGDPNKKKKAYYVEGGPYEFGRLMGRLAKADIRRMANEYADNFIFAFLNIESIKEQAKGINDLDELLKILGELLIDFVVYPMTEKQYATSVPLEIQEEIRGMVDGGGYILPCRRMHLWKHLKVLNLGVDVLSAFVYSLDPESIDRLNKKAGKKLPEGVKLDRSFFKTPVSCNAFSIFGQAAGGGHYFGRDFMFPNAGVFQDVAAMVVYNPDPEPGKVNLPLVSVTAPGFAGSIAAMNTNGVAAGVDMRPAKNCNCENIGLNSLSMVRCAIQHSGTGAAAADFITSATRGVSWIYPISDGAVDRACIVEAGAPGVNPLEHIPAEMLPLLPPGPFPTQGCQIRWSDDPNEAKKILENIQKYNPNLASHFGKPDPDATPFGYVDQNSDHGAKGALEHNCPSVYYFAPPRWTGDSACNQGQTLIAANHYLDPVMRLYSMSGWLNVLSGLMGYVEDDSQWRYDQLNHEICEALGVGPTALKPTKTIDYSKAKQLIEFLAPYPDWPCNKYYNPHGQDWKTIEIGGCISLFDLKNKIVETHAGYYGDEWSKITLPNYLP